MYDIVWTADDITSTLSHQTTVFMMSRPLQSWHHTPCLRHCTHCIFFIMTSPLISHPLLYDILPTFCVPSYELYITSHPILMSSHYSTYDIRTSICKSTSYLEVKIYNIQVTSEPFSVSSQQLYRKRHTHSLYDITLAISVASFALYKTSYPKKKKKDITSSLHDLYPSFFDTTPTTFDMVSTVSVPSHTLYWWYHTNCIYEITSAIIHGIIYFVYDMTATVSVPSQPLVWWYHTLCMYDIKPTISIISYTLYKASHSHFMISHLIMYDITCTVFMKSLPLYQLNQTHSLYDITHSM